MSAIPAALLREILTMAPLTAALAANRFGLGAGKSELDDIGSHGVDWLRAQLKRTGPAFDASNLSPSHQTLTRFFDERRQRQKTKRENPERGNPRALMEVRRTAYENEITARTKRAVATDAPLRERLAHFWSNHFTVSATKPQVAAIAGAYEREAIRPHITGGFFDMTLAALKHPAMLLYLDNAQSTGPNSPVGKRRKRGLNENLAREVLELHTMGAAGGYTQDDVIALAKALTGWTVVGRRAAHGTPGTFSFDARRHEPGAKTLLGKTYRTDGQRQAENMLADVMRHPATATHIATKLARHFTADAPPGALIDRLAANFRKTDGDLEALANTLISSPEPWQTPLAKFKTPHDFIISALRGLDAPPEKSRHLLGAYTMLGQRPFFAPSPAGWPDDALSWVGPDAIKKRLEWANALTARIPAQRDPRDLAERLLGETLKPQTRQAIARASDASQGFVLLFMSPEFQRR